MSPAPLLPEIILAGGALVLLLLDPFSTGVRRGGNAILALVVISASAAALLVQAPAEAPAFAGTFFRDGLGRAFGLLALLVSALTVLASRGYVLARLPSVGTEYYTLLLFATAGMLLLVSSEHLVTLFVALELMSVSTFALAGLLRGDRRSAEGGMKFFLLGALSSAVLLYGIAILYGLSGSLELAAIGKALNRPVLPPAAFVALVFVLAGFGFKLSLVPFHMWCPDTYEGAPTPVAGFLSVGSKGAALVALWRVLTEGFVGMTPEWEKLVWLLAASSMVLGNVVAILQPNLKRMLAYSTIAQAGYLMVGLLASSEVGAAAIFFYIAVYAFMSLGAFAAVAYLSHLGLGEEWADAAGLSRAHPLLAAALSLFLLSMAGVPPLAGFAGKLFLFSAAIERGHYALVVLAVLTSVVSLFYYVRVMRYLYVVAPPDASPVPAAGPDRGLAVVLAAGVMGTLLLGVYPQPMVSFLLEAVHRHFH